MYSAHLPCYCPLLQEAPLRLRLLHEDTMEEGLRAPVADGVEAEEGESSQTLNLRLLALHFGTFTQE